MTEKGFRTGIVSRLVGITYGRIVYYDEHGFVSPSIKRASGKGSRRLYSRSDLEQLLVLRRLIDSGLRLEKVRRALAECKRRYKKIKNPLIGLSFRTDGISVYTEDPKSGVLLDLLNPRQPVLSAALKPITTQIDHKIAEFEDHRIEELRIDGKTYLIEIVNDTETHGYVVRCPELLGISVKGRTVESALVLMRERIEEALTKLR